MGVQKISVGLPYRKTLKRLRNAVLIGLSAVIYFNRKQIDEYLRSLVEQPNNETKKGPDYIYIQYHVYKETLRQMQEEEEEGKKLVNIMINPVAKWWKSIKHSVAWRLLNIAKTGDQHERIKAVRQLSKIDHLKDWDFRHLAQICDARTAVSLARMGADQRWFIPVTTLRFIMQPYDILAQSYDFLNQFLANNCVKCFVSKYFPEPDPPNISNAMLVIEKQYSPSLRELVLLRELVTFLEHITKDRCMAEEVIKHGMMMHLMEFKKIFANDYETLASICKVLANLSVLKSSVEHFHVTGWISVLADWQKSSDIRLKVISSKTLANLDHDDPNYIVYPAHIFPLHPLQRSSVKPKADVIFVHGLVGSVFVTWRQKERLTKEVPNDDVPEDFNKDSKPKCDNVETEEEEKSNFFKGIQRKFPLVEKTWKQLIGAEPSDIVNGAYNILFQEFGDFFPRQKHKKPELTSDWEVVHHDIPIAASGDAGGCFSVQGNKWKNEESAIEYTNCWPMEWLPKDFPNIRIIGIDYSSALTQWSSNFTKYCPCEKTQGHIEIRSSFLLDALVKSQVGKNRPVVWIGHSMGGLLTKLILLKSHEHPEIDYKQVAAKTKAIVFLGTPHRGSPVAKWKQHMQIIISPSIEVKEMEENAPKLLELHQKFMHCLERNLKKIKVVSIAEGSPTMFTTFKFPVQVVTIESARIDYGDFYLVNDDHLNLSKPIFRQSFLYQRFLQIIEDATNEKPQKKDSDCLTKKQRSNSVVDKLLSSLPNLMDKVKDFWET